MPIGRDDLSLLGPDHSCQVPGAGEFPLPFLDIAVFIACLKEDHHVRINELEICNCSLDGHRLDRVVRGVSMMCKQRQRNRQSNDGCEDPTVRPRMFLRYQ